MAGLSIESLLYDYDGREGRDIFAKVREFQLAEQARAAGLYAFFQPLDRNDGAEAEIYGRRVLMLGSNNYLGLTRHPRVIKAAQDAVAEHGTSLTGSRLLNGTTHLHEELENRIAEFLGAEAALVFTTGYQTNLGVISSLVNRRSVAVVDKADHASIYDGCRLAEGEMLRFRHNDAQHLDTILRRIDKDKPCLVVIDGVFSMGGDIADLPGIVEVCRRHEARLLVDDAHAIGVIGKGGRGTASHFGLEGTVDLTVGTFSKSLASVGGFVVGERAVLEWIKHFARSMIFSASLPPASAAAALAALEVLMEEPERVAEVQRKGDTLRNGLRDMGFDTGDSQTPIIPVTIGDEVATLTFWRDLLECGVYTNPVMFPAAAMGKALLRTSCMATHTDEQIEFALEQFQSLGRKHGLLP
ncbi:MAG: pyridoxal phosphate-dependent aminotransferase family protein [Dehalococcoidia bacterium]|nr:pyridoxal phosphate-dependent aminotransferase family protein [Dehalococcoidia bacterium]